MKIICIAGYCGTGKTPAIRILVEHLEGAEIIRGDTYLIDAILNEQKKFEEIYNIKKLMNV